MLKDNDSSCSLGIQTIDCFTKGQNWPNLKCLIFLRQASAHKRAPFSEYLDLVCEPREGIRPTNPGILEKKVIEDGYFEHFQEREKRGREE